MLAETLAGFGADEAAGPARPPARDLNEIAAQDDRLADRSGFPLRVDLTGLPRRLGTAAICAHRTAGVDVNRSLILGDGSRSAQPISPARMAQSGSLSAYPPISLGSRKRRLAVLSYKAFLGQRRKLIANRLNEFLASKTQVAASNTPPYAVSSA